MSGRWLLSHHFGWRYSSHAYSYEEKGVTIYCGYDLWN